MRKSPKSSAVPFINVTPLIDVLLVLLIIFMVVTPLKPKRFITQVPEPPDKSDDSPADSSNLVVTIREDRTLELNSTGGMGSVDEAGKLSAELSRIFKARVENRAYDPEKLYRDDLPAEARIRRTVFIKAPRSMSYGEVVKVVDGVKGAGAQPVGLQLDGLN